MDEAVGLGAVRIEIDIDRVATVWIDSPSAKVNTLSTFTWDGLDAAVRAIERQRPAGVVIASAKPRTFVAGADLFELEAMGDSALEAYLERGQGILDHLAGLPMPTVAAINGDALGGGLEVALACRFRVVADDARIKLGLPETTLGLVPGWGGTFRLPRLVGIEQALSLLVSGKSVAPNEAAASGLVDAIVPCDNLLDFARSYALSPPAQSPRARESRELIRDVCTRFRHATRERSGDHLPAPLRVIDVVETGYVESHDAAMAAERSALVAMRRSPAGKQLLRTFFVRTAAKKKALAEAGGTPCAVASVVVIGGGTMGAGMAAAFSSAGLPVTIVEADETSARSAARRLAAMPGGDAVGVGADWSHVATADLVVEAVTEDRVAKEAIFRRLGELARPDAILATNTSSIGVASLARVARHPSRVIGLHFFNPVARMALVEVVRGADSEPDAVATGVAVASRLGKNPIVCRDSPGFVVNRVLFPYLRAALTLVDAGAGIDELDAAVRHWGMPMGPCAVLDEVGLDVSVAIFASLSATLGERLAVLPTLAKAVEHGWLGKKSGRGLLVHTPGRKSEPNTEWASLTHGPTPPKLLVEEGDIDTLLFGPMAAEARAILDEEIVSSSDALDLASILGMGFPAFRGGLATYANERYDTAVHPIAGPYI